MDVVLKDIQAGVMAALGAANARMGGMRMAGGGAPGAGAAGAAATPAAPFKASFDKFSITSK